MKTILAALLCAGLANGADMQGGVQPVRLDYVACVSHVAQGGKAILAVGVDAPPGAYRVASLQGFTPGLYECFLDGTPKMRPLAVPKPMAGPVKQWVKQCYNGVCRLVEVDAK